MPQLQQTIQQLTQAFNSLLASFKSHIHNGTDSAKLAFINLFDVPTSYSKNAGQIVIVNPTTNGLIFTNELPNTLTLDQNLVVKGSSIIDNNLLIEGQMTVEGELFGDTIITAPQIIATGFSRVMVYNSGNQDITSTGDKLVTLTFEYYDTQGEFSSSRFTAKEAGYYLASASIIFFPDTTNLTMSQFMIERYNALPSGDTRDIAKSIIWIPDTEPELATNLSGIAYLGIGDWIELHTQQANGQNYTISANSYLEIQRLV